MKTVEYSCSYPMLLNDGQPQHQVGRPWLEVVVSGKHGGNHRVMCLVDTGSDATILDLTTANSLGVYPDELEQFTIAGVGGTADFGILRDVRVEFAGTELITTVLLGPVRPPLLGRDALFDAGLGLEYGFERDWWHHT